MKEMKTIHLGKTLQQQRKMLGMSQEMVCEGLCTIMTLSRFESGRQTPSRDCVMAMLQRLGLPDDRFYAQLTRTETKLVRLRKEVLAHYNRFEQTSGEEQQQARAKALETLQKLEHCIKADDRINQQFILGMKAFLETYSPSKRLDMLMDAIRLTSPRFDLNKLSNCLYCVSEVAIICKIAISYSQCGQRRKAIDILDQLLKLVLKQNPDHNYLPLILYNYARYLGLENQLDKALEISKLGRQVCIGQEHYHLLPKFLHIEAECYYLMGEINRNTELLRSAYHIYGAIMDSKNQEILKADSQERFNLVI